jgi:hypothetical protein
VISAAAPQYSPVSSLIVPSAGQPFTGPVGSFDDTNLGDTQTDFTAVITWGDGHTSEGDVSGGNGSFQVTGTNTYARAGTYQPSIQVEDGNGNPFTINSTAVVIGPVITPIGTAVNFIAGVQPSQAVIIGAFFDSDSAASASDFTASITWGDGHVSAGVVSYNSALSRFEVRDRTFISTPVCTHPRFR